MSSENTGFDEVLSLIQGLKTTDTKSKPEESAKVEESPPKAETEMELPEALQPRNYIWEWATREPFFVRKSFQNPEVLDDQKYLNQLHRRIVHGPVGIGSGFIGASIKCDEKEGDIVITWDMGRIVGIIGYTGDPELLAEPGLKKLDEYMEDGKIRDDYKAGIRFVLRKLFPYFCEQLKFYNMIFTDEITGKKITIVQLCNYADNYIENRNDRNFGDKHYGITTDFGHLVDKKFNFIDTWKVISAQKKHDLQIMNLPSKVNSARPVGAW